MATSEGSAVRDTVAWAHLSAFHFTADKDYGRDEVLLALLEDLKRFSKPGDERERGAEHVPLDLLLITGDIAHAGKREEYDKAEVFFKELCSATAVPPERVFLVPGNHDVDIARDVPKFMREGLQGRLHFEEYWKNTASRPSLFGSKLAAFREFASRFNPHIEIRVEQPGGGRELTSEWTNQWGQATERVNCCPCKQQCTCRGVRPDNYYAALPLRCHAARMPAAVSASV